MMQIHVRQATADDVAEIEAQLVEAAAWVDALGAVMWEEGELDRGRIAGEVAAGQFFIADANADPAGAVRFQLDDQLFWPDQPRGEAAFVHRLVVRRRFKGAGVSTALLQWAVERTRGLGLAYLRLDCDADRHRLRAMYERFGFSLHSYRQVGAYYVARYQYRV